MRKTTEIIKNWMAKPNIITFFNKSCDKILLYYLILLYLFPAVEPLGNNKHILPMSAFFQAFLENFSQNWLVQRYHLLTQ